MVTESGDLLILAVQRGGEEVPGKTALEVGDTMLLQGTWSALDKRLADPEVLVVHSPDVVRRQAVPMGTARRRRSRSWWRWSSHWQRASCRRQLPGWWPRFLMVLLRVLSVDQAYRSVNWTTVILVGAMTPLSAAMSETGAAQLLADKLVARGRRCRSLRAARGSFRADCGHRPTHQQHRHGADHHPDRGRGCARSSAFRPARS